MRREAAMTTKVLSSSPISRGGPAKGNGSADGGLVRASESPSGDPTRDLTAPRWPSVRIPSAPPATRRVYDFGARLKEDTTYQWLGRRRGDPWPSLQGSALLWAQFGGFVSG